MGRPPGHAQAVPAPPLADRRWRGGRGWPKSGAFPLGAARARLVRAVRCLRLAQPGSWDAEPPPPTFADRVVAWLNGEPSGEE